MRGTLSSRWRFLKVVGAGAAVSLLAACEAGPVAPALTQGTTSPAAQPTTAPIGASTTSAAIRHASPLYGGRSSAELAGLVRAAGFTRVEVESLSDPDLWSGAPDAERYSIVATAAKR